MLYFLTNSLTLKIYISFSHCIFFAQGQFGIIKPFVALEKADKFLSVVSLSH